MMARQGRLQGQLEDSALKQMLEQVYSILYYTRYPTTSDPNRAARFQIEAGGAGSGAGITWDRRKNVVDSDESDVDLSDL